MVDWVTREEFGARVGYLEREVEGEKMVSRHILEQTRRNSDDLAAIKSRLDRVERKVDGLEQRFSGLEQRFDSLEQRFDSLDQKFGSLDRKVDSLDGLVRGFATDLPRAVAEVMREVLHERDGKA